jgi:hypothetical protein
LASGPAIKRVIPAEQCCAPTCSPQLAAIVDRARSNSAVDRTEKSCRGRLVTSSGLSRSPADHQVIAHGKLRAHGAYLSFAWHAKGLHADPSCIMPREGHPTEDPCVYPCTPRTCCKVLHTQHASKAPGSGQIGAREVAGSSAQEACRAEHCSCRSRAGEGMPGRAVCWSHIYCRMVSTLGCRPLQVCQCCCSMCARCSHKLCSNWRRASMGTPQHGRCGSFMGHSMWLSCSGQVGSTADA